MKCCFVIMLMLNFPGIADAQIDSTYKYVYTFRPDAPTDKPSVVIDSSFNTKDTSFELQVLTSIQGEVRDNSGKPIAYPTICLDSNNAKIWCITKSDGMFDRPVAAGSYTLSADAVGYKSFAYNFSIAYQTTIHFNIMLATAQSLDEYEIHSRVKLTGGDIKRIKACAVGREDFYKCGKTNVYVVLMQI